MDFTKAVAFLIFYHLIFFWPIYTNIFKQATSEVLSTFFPHWIWSGRELKRGRWPMRDDIYYYYPGSIPFLSTFYPPHFLSAFLSTFLSLNQAFVLHLIVINSHYVLGSILSFFLFSQWAPVPIALFGAITLTYCAYSLKIQPCIVYTVNWLPGILLGGPLGMISAAMAILGGYWPLCVYFFPVAIGTYLLWDYNLFWFIGGSLISLPQIIPFMRYYPKSVRAKKTGNPGRFGKMPVSRLLNLILPDNSSKYVNGVLSQEMALYIGPIPLVMTYFSESMAWLILPVAFLGMIGVLPSFGRISARWIHLFNFSLVWLAVSGMTRFFEPPGTKEGVIWVLLALQAAMLLVNRQQLSYWPFTEWWKKPSEFWKGGYSEFNSDYPYFAGYVTETKTPGYTGGFALQSMHDKYGITDPNGIRQKTFL